jgi:hypothetical protein
VIVNDVHTVHRDTVNTLWLFLHKMQLRGFRGASLGNPRSMRTIRMPLHGRASVAAGSEAHAHEQLDRRSLMLSLTSTVTIMTTSCEPFPSQHHSHTQALSHP